MIDVDFIVDAAVKANNFSPRVVNVYYRRNKGEWQDSLTT